MKMLPSQDISGYMPIDECFVKDLDKATLFMCTADNDNKEFGIKRGAYILCKMGEAKDGELIVDRESLSPVQGTYKVMRMIKRDGFVFLENSRGQKICSPDYKNFGVVVRIFNVNK